VVQRLSRTSKYYPEGIQKVTYVWWFCVRPQVRFVERTSDGPPAYVRTTDNSVRPPNLAYVHPKVQITLLAALVTQSPNQLPQLSHLCLVSNLGHYNLPMDHLFRQNKRTFDGNQELGCAPDVPSGVEILR
jgi:hypothetical protein